MSVRSRRSEACLLCSDLSQTVKFRSKTKARMARPQTQDTGLLCVTVSTFTHRSYKPVLVVSCLYPLVARTGVGLDLNDRSHPDITSHPMVAMMHGQSQMDADCLAFNKNTKLPAEDCIIAMPRPEQV